MYPVRRQNSPHTARLRLDRTDAEDKLWQALRNRQIDGAKFRFQASLWPYVAEFLCVEAKLIVEVDSGQHSEVADARRSAELEARGYRIQRFWNTDVLANLEGVVGTIRVAVRQKKRTLTQLSLVKTGESYSVMH